VLILNRTTHYDPLPAKSLAAPLAAQTAILIGLGLLFASRLGGWQGDNARAGLRLALGSAIVFSVLAMFFGSRTFGAIGPILLIGLGVWLLFRARRVPTA
jgi:hypothetical protein